MYIVDSAGFNSFEKKQAPCVSLVAASTSTRGDIVYNGCEECMWMRDVKQIKQYEGVIQRYTMIGTLVVYLMT